MRIKHIQIISLVLLSILIASCSTSDDTLEDIVTEQGDLNNEEEQEQQETSTDPNDDNEDVEGQTTDPLSALVMTDVSYGDNFQQVYDIYLPEGRDNTKTKIIILIHGGGWTSGDKSGMQDFVNFFLENHPDHAIVNMNYVLAAPFGPTAFPNQYLNIEAVINQITEQQEELQVLPEFGLLGASAGAQLAMMYDYTYDTEDIVKFVVDIVGPSDFTDPFFTQDPGFPLLLNLLVDLSQFPAGTDLVVANSPALVANSTSSPTLLFYGNEDPLVPLTNGEVLDNELEELGIPHEFTVYDGGHGNDWSEEDILDLQFKTSSYVDTYLVIE